MGLINGDETYLASAFVGRGCAYCGRVIQEGQSIVEWMPRGDAPWWAVHQPCAQVLGIHLIKDSFGRGDTYVGTHERCDEPTGECRHTFPRSWERPT